MVAMMFECREKREWFIAIDLHVERLIINLFNPLGTRWVKYVE